MNQVRFLFCRSLKLTRPVLEIEIESVPTRIQPCIDAATAVPTKQSNPWLSGCSGCRFHSSTLRPLASVLMKSSEVKFSPSMRCVSAFVPKSERQLRSPVEIWSRALIDDFHQLVCSYQNGLSDSSRGELQSTPHPRPFSPRRLLL